MEVDGPAAIVRFFEPNPFIRQRVGDVHEALAETKGAGGRDGFDEVVSRVLRYRESRGLRAR